MKDNLEKRTFTLWFLRWFSIFRDLESNCDFLIERVNDLDEKTTELEKQAESDKNLIASLDRYIEVLEGRDKVRVETIEELKLKHKEACDAIKGMRTRLAGLLPEHKEETSL